VIVKNAVRIADFSLRVRPCRYKARMRKWLYKHLGEVIIRDWGL